MPTYTNLKYVRRAGEPLLTEQLEDNLISFFDYGLVNTGHFYNVSISQSGAYGPNNSKLSLASLPNYTTGQVWQSYRKNWVNDTDVEYATLPINVSGVYVNNVFQPSSGVGAYAHKVDFKNGRVVFTSPISTSSVVKAEFSWKSVAIERAEHPYFRNIQYDSYKSNAPSLSTPNSGLYSIPAENRVQLPAVFVEVLSNRYFEPREIGGGSIVSNGVHFHVVAENSRDRGHLIDIISCQYQKEFWLYDKRTAPFQLEPDGSKASGAMSYPMMVSESGCRWRECYFEMSMVEDVGLNAPGLFIGSVRLTPKIIMPEV